MRVNLCQVMKYAQEHHMAIAALNCPTLESAQAAVEAAEERQIPVILQHAPVHEPFISLELAGTLMNALAEGASIPICVHLDHGDSPDTVMRAIRSGYTSIMYDASAKSFEDNLEETRQIARLAHAVGVSVEAELGHMPHNFRGELADYNPEMFYTRPDEAQAFARETGVDALAISFGTVHGVYRSTPKLNFEIVHQIREATNGLPLVMHGGSGLSDEDYRRAIQNGIRKINYYTYEALAGGEGIYQAVKEHPQGLYFHDAAQMAKAAMRKDIAHILRIFSGGER